MYLLLPLENFNTFGEGSWRINWSAINPCAAVVEFIKKNSFLGAAHCNNNRGNSSPYRTSPCETECHGMDVIHLANWSVDAKNLKDMVVLATHTGRIYSIVEVVSNSSAESPFDGNTDDDSSKTFVNYFSEKSVVFNPG